MTWSISLTGHSNNSDSNLSESEVIKAEYSSLVQRLRGAGLLVTGGSCSTNYGGLTPVDVPEVDINEINAINPGTPGDNGGFASSATGTQGGDARAYQDAPPTEEETPSE